MAEKMTLEKLALITMRGFEELRAEFKGELKREISALRTEMRAEFKLVHQELKLLRDSYENHEQRVTRLEEKVL